MQEREREREIDFQRLRDIKVKESYKHPIQGILALANTRKGSKLCLLAMQRKQSANRE